MMQPHTSKHVPACAAWAAAALVTLAPLTVWSQTAPPTPPSYDFDAARRSLRALQHDLITDAIQCERLHRSRRAQRRCIDRITAQHNRRLVELQEASQRYQRAMDQYLAEQYRWLHRPGPLDGLPLDLRDGAPNPIDTPADAPRTREVVIDTRTAPSRRL